MLDTEIKQPNKKPAVAVRVTVKTKIWITVLSVVMMFSFFILFYFPAVQEAIMLKNYNNQIQNLANTVSLGVKIALKEQDFEGVQTAFNFVKQDPHLEFVSLVQIDTVWNSKHSGYTTKKKIFKTYPDNLKIDVNAQSNSSQIIKRSFFKTPILNGEIILSLNTLEIASNKTQIRLTSLIVSAMVFIIGILMGFILAKNISEPVLKLRDAANRVSEGDLTQHVRSHSRDEIGELGNAFNKMVSDLNIAREEIEERQAEITRQRDQLTVTVTELKTTQQQLVQSEKLASIGQLTKGIVDRLLNPLNYINNFSMLSKNLMDDLEEIFGKPELTDDDKEEVVDLIATAKSNLHKVTEHGTSAARIIKAMEKIIRKRSTDFVDTDLNQLIDTSIKTVRADLHKEYPDIHLEIAEYLDVKGSHVKILPFEISIAVINLINNAAFSVVEKLKQNTGFNPKIAVATMFNETSCEIRITDNGKGILAADMKQLFSPFFTTKPTAKGTGLGLYLTQEIIKQHEGTITVNTKEGEFTEFVIILPA